MILSNYLTPEELITLYPKAKEFGWTLSEINLFIATELVKTNKSEEQSLILVREDSFANLIEYAEGVALKKKELGL